MKESWIFFAVVIKKKTSMDPGSTDWVRDDKMVVIPANAGIHVSCGGLTIDFREDMAASLTV